MKAVKLTLSGTEHYLAFNGEAMFDIHDAFGGAQALLEDIAPNTKDAFASLCKAVAILAQQGELVRRDLGCDPQRIYTADDFRRFAMPEDILAMKQAIPQAITLGFGREIVPENDEVDLGLAELNQKKRPDPRPLHTHGDTVGVIGARDAFSAARAGLRHVRALFKNAGL